MAIKAKASRQIPLPTIGRQGPTGKKATTPAKPKQNGKANSSILSFFKKADGGDDDVGLFVGDGGLLDTRIPDVDIKDLSPEQGTAHPGLENAAEDHTRFNENGGSLKKRKTSFGNVEALEPPTTLEAMPHVAAQTAGPFFEESDSEQGEEQPEAIIGIGGESEDTAAPAHSNDTDDVPDGLRQEKASDEVKSELFERPPLIKEETSYGADMDAFRDFEGMGDFDEDLFEEGDEFLERRYMEDEARLELEQDEADGPDSAGVVSRDVVSAKDDASCPVCGISVAGIDEQVVGVHVNNCLDGNPTPLPEAKKPPDSTPVIKSENTVSADQFRRPVRPAKPGQANPFTFGEASMNGGSAFNKLMSGHVEDAAWAEAAASEHASRGKPSYQRTCPFYKILPGLFICVDAFRYGAVAGCKAYFLSHFHSDHYVGLTSSWSHGPIYCSRTTGNLVRQQLRVDPKYVIDLEFEQQAEVPGTKGVNVTMIPANHCPGSSLYLFEKVVGKKSNGEPRLQRILHCGDFRACRTHVEHPLLMPDVQDKVSGKTREQKIDVCYLDTTYLNPKYAFPSQELVIKACADMCVSLSKHTVDENDGWEQMKRRRAGEGMVKFVRKESQAEIKEEPADDDETSTEIKVERNPHASQQILSSTGEQKARGRLLVIVGTYSIGKERICLGIARALDSKIYAPPSKQRIVAALEDPELTARMTTDPHAAQVHMTPLFEIRAETLDDYLKAHFPHFTRAVAFRPSGWSYRPPASRFLDSPAVATVLAGPHWRSPYTLADLVPQRGSTSRAACFAVPYSEHSSFRELTMFCCALRIDKIIPTVNVGSARSRERMKAWCERWAAERRKNGVWRPDADELW